MQYIFSFTIVNVKTVLQKFSPTQTKILGPPLIQYTLLPTHLPNPGQFLYGVSPESNLSPEMMQGATKTGFSWSLQNASGVRTVAACDSIGAAVLRGVFWRFCCMVRCSPFRSLK
eukprot:TRINITY_DN9641_c0_g1_i2.p1 TRINITY_DN9641_c0_g1~~TRINITY_DN9641_c0_g1_i2.p1  ORF type:complete len:115 (+),score=12.63 TRINITY_DN9641_c0_g1_i2:229-573(+)